MEKDNSNNKSAAKVTAIALCSVILAAAVGVGVWKVILPKNSVSTDNTAVNGEISQNEQDFSSRSTTNSVLYSSQASSRSETSHTASVKSKSEPSEVSSKKTSSKKSSSATSSQSKKESSKSSSSQTSSNNASRVTSTAAYTEYYDPHPVETVSQNTTSVVEPVEPEIDEPIVEPEVVYYEEFDEYGRLYIDTDTLNGQKAAAITFDDGPSDYTAQLLDGLKARNVHATFFIVGSRAEIYPDIVRRVADEGHQLGNHTYSHPVMTSLYEYSWRNEIDVTDSIITNICGKTPTAFRPPYGSFSSYMAASINKTFTVWSVDTLDWQTRNAVSVKNAMVDQCRDGKIILLHDLYKTSVDGALAAIDVLQSEGYVFVTVDELLTRYGYPISNTAHYSQYPVSQTVLRERPKEDTDSVTDTETDTDTETNTETNIDSETDTEENTDIVSDNDTDSTEDSETDSAEELQDTEDNVEDDNTVQDSENKMHTARLSFNIQKNILFS
ncbi:MAG: polysaccharide deacetylase family protein [Acutalibacteraceae bacterium]|nr:polysaccharide deacetylase family protein [Acutalibacteraceae bacterium]